MATLYSPQSQTGIMSFYDAPTKGPSVNPKIVIAMIMVFAIVVIIIDRVAAL